MKPNEYERYLKKMMAAITGPDGYTVDGQPFTLADVMAGKVRGVYNSEKGDFEYRLWKESKPQKRRRPLCAARCRDGHACRARVALDDKGAPRRRCKVHGGLSTGPRTAEGRARIAESNRRRAKTHTV
jgi:hypothetical protein